MENCLIGYSGFVGHILQKQNSFHAQYRSTNISQIKDRSFDILVCAGAQAQKWLVNREPENDLQSIKVLIENLRSVNCKTFILISTVDVFGNSLSVDESTVVNENNLHAYGLHRRLLEKFVESHFPSHLIVRLPGLVGPGLRKNIIFDLLNSNNLSEIDSRNIFQFYPMVNLWYDIQIALNAGLNLVHLTAEPISVSEVSVQGFGRQFQQFKKGDPVSYDFRTRYGNIFGVSGYYQYSKHDSIQAIRAYAQSEPKTSKMEKVG